MEFAERPDWMKKGACLGLVDVMFPQNAMAVDAAKRICDGCEVQKHCLEYALDHRVDHGVWGGASERERRTLRRARRRAG